MLSLLNRVLFAKIFDMIKLSKFNGVLILPTDISEEAIDRVIGFTKQYEFKQKDEREVTQHFLHKKKIEQRTKERPGFDQQLL